jgi:hypothetical protein
MRYKYQNYSELEKTVNKLMMVLIALSLIGTLLVALLIFKGCQSESKLNPVHFKEQYTPTKFNKL